MNQDLINYLNAVKTSNNNSIAAYQGSIDNANLQIDEFNNQINFFQTKLTELTNANVMIDQIIAFIPPEA